MFRSEGVPRLSLKLPIDRPQKYTTKKGDTLLGIVKDKLSFCKTATETKAAILLIYLNNKSIKSVHDIKPGMKLTLPTRKDVSGAIKHQNHLSYKIVGRQLPKSFPDYSISQLYKMAMEDRIPNRWLERPSK
ncbi:hypothetical protein ACFLZ2_05455 [Candidatus Margulisiibacteriota bacterium]